MRYVFPANVNRPCAIMDHSAVGASGDIKGSFCCLAAYSLQIEHWLAKWRISFVMPGQNMTSLAHLVQATGPWWLEWIFCSMSGCIAFGITTFVPLKTMFLSTTSSSLYGQKARTERGTLFVEGLVELHAFLFGTLLELMIYQMACASNGNGQMGSKMLSNMSWHHPASPDESHL